MEKLTQDSLPLTVCIQVAAAESLESRYVIN